MKRGLVLEGGAMRGLFTAGVLDVLMAARIVFDGAVGVSAGAAFGCNYKSWQAGRVLRYNTRFCKDRRYCSLTSLLTTGDLYGADFCYRRLPEELDPFDWETYEKNPMEFYAVCTDLESGEPVLFSCTGKRERVMDIFRASASMPLVSRTVWLDGKPYLDGGIAVSVPLALWEKRGYEKNVVVLTQPRDYVKKASRVTALTSLRYRKYPAFCQAAKERFSHYNAEREYVFQREKEGKAFVIAPPAPLPVGRTEKDPEKLRLAYEWGKAEAEKNLSSLKEFLL
jgi:predicted patatin/cPLA2 family phospholipase